LIFRGEGTKARPSISKFFKELILIVDMASSRDESREKEPVMCSKCNEVFETDSKYMQHYESKHKPEEKDQA